MGASGGQRGPEGASGGQWGLGRWRFVLVATQTEERNPRGAPGRVRGGRWWGVGRQSVCCEMLVCFALRVELFHFDAFLISMWLCNPAAVPMGGGLNAQIISVMLGEL